jgi:hypothetical protein
MTLRGLLFPSTFALAAVAFTAAPPLAARQDNYRAAVFALIDANEWCPGGSVYLDLETGAFMRHPRPIRADCRDAGDRAPVEQGRLADSDLRRLRAAYLEARRVGLRREECSLIVTNGGPEALAITAPGFSAVTPDNMGCWSDAAEGLHRELFELFGEQSAASGASH